MPSEQRQWMEKGCSVRATQCVAEWKPLLCFAAAAAATIVDIQKTIDLDSNLDLDLDPDLDLDLDLDLALDLHLDLDEI